MQVGFSIIVHACRMGNQRIQTVLLEHRLQVSGVLGQACLGAAAALLTFLIQFLFSAWFHD